MIHMITDEGMHAGHDDKGREFTFLTNAENSKRAAYEDAINSFGGEFGISDLAYDAHDQPLPNNFAIYVLSASPANRLAIIDHFVAVEECLDREARTVK
jgi:hypothetical protein